VRRRCRLELYRRRWIRWLPRQHCCHGRLPLLRPATFLRTNPWSVSRFPAPPVVVWSTSPVWSHRSVQQRRDMSLVQRVRVNCQQHVDLVRFLPLFCHQLLPCRCAVPVLQLRVTTTVYGA
jgi:hypothetical protein